MVNTEVLKYGHLILNSDRRSLHFSGKLVSLRNKEFELIKFFMENAGRVLSRTLILEEVWDRNICCSTNTVDVHVSTLRKKLQKSSKNAVIQTIHCVGYLLMG